MRRGRERKSKEKSPWRMRWRTQISWSRLLWMAFASPGNHKFFKPLMSSWVQFPNTFQVSPPVRQFGKSSVNFASVDGGWFISLNNTSLLQTAQYFREMVTNHRKLLLPFFLPKFYAKKCSWHQFDSFSGLMRNPHLFQEITVALYRWLYHRIDLNERNKIKKDEQKRCFRSKVIDKNVSTKQFFKSLYNCQHSLLVSFCNIDTFFFAIAL